MMPDFLSSPVFYWIGVSFVGIVALAVIAALSLLASMLIVSFAPRLHFGAPKLTSEWAFYREYSINDDPVKKPEQVYLVPWWFGWSSRRKASWFIGFVRMKALP
jgi:hypothetical protein